MGGANGIPEIWVNGGYLQVEDLLELAPMVEELGIDGIAMPDHLLFPEFTPGTYPYTSDGSLPFRIDAPWLDPWVTIGALAAVTKTLKFTTSIYIPGLRHPLQVANAIATAANVSRGRVSLGVGTGWMPEEFTAVGLDIKDRGALLDEMLVALRALWGKPPVEHHGRFFSFGPLYLEPVPSSPIQILVGGISPHALRRAVKHGDGCTFPDLAPERIPEVVESVRSDLVAAGRDPDSFLFSVKCGDQPTIEEICRHAHPHVDSIRVVAWPHPGKVTTTLDQKKQGLEAFAKDVLGPMRDRLAATVV